MKKKNSYLLVLISFIVIMSLILYFFMLKNNEIDTLNKSKELLIDLYDLNEGEYYLKDGILYTSNDYIVGNKTYVLGNGPIVIDKYKNVKFNIEYEDKCINKTSLGNIKIINEKCGNFKTIDIHMSRNNKVISFSSNVDNLEYKISYNDDFRGIFVNDNYKDNIVLKKYNEGTNYIWFKDKDGNLSDTYTFHVDCLNTYKAKYDKNVFYCSGSTVIVDNIEWVVIKDSNSEIKLMKFLPLEDKMYQCESDCKDYKWSTSYINEYLNQEFINKLSEETKKSLLKQDVCEDYYSKYCDNEICGGFSKEEIDAFEYSCIKYSSSLVKVISYYEFNYIYSHTKDKNVLNGNYWAINSFEEGLGSSIQYNQDFYVLEKYTNKLDVRPVITLGK